MPIAFNERLDLLQRISRSWLDLKKAVESLSPTELGAPVASGGWSGRDLAVHIATWDDELTRVLFEREGGNPEAWLPASGVTLDAWNEERMADFRNLPLDDALDYFEQAHFELMELLEQSPSVTRSLVEPLIAHYHEHLEQLAALRRRRSR